MKILYSPEPKPSLPKGKVSVRWVKYRAIHQVYVGGRFLPGASGHSEKDAIESMESQYECGTK